MRHTNAEVSLHTHELNELRPGDRVRSFDFGNPPVSLRLTSGPWACFVEGVIEKIGRFPEVGPSSCDHYKIRIERCVFKGQEVEDHPPYAYPPVNGVPIWGNPDMLTCGVEKI